MTTCPICDVPTELHSGDDARECLTAFGAALLVRRTELQVEQLELEPDELVDVAGATAARVLG